MRKNSLPTGAKIALICGLVLVLAGAVWFGYTALMDGSTPTNPVDDIPAHSQPTNPVSDIKKVYKEYPMPESKNVYLYDESLDMKLVESGRLFDNAALTAALREIGVEYDGYYFLAELSFDGEDAFRGVLPFAYLNGMKDGSTQVASVSLYLLKSDLTSAQPLTGDALTQGCHYVLVGYADFESVDDAQIHMYNSNYDVSVIHMGPDVETIAPLGYTQVQDDVHGEEDIPVETDPVESGADTNPDATEDTNVDTTEDTNAESPDDIGGGGVPDVG